MKGPYWQTYREETTAHVYIFDRKTDRVTRFCDGDGFDSPDDLKGITLDDHSITTCQECIRLMSFIVGVA